MTSPGKIVIVWRSLQVRKLWPMWRAYAWMPNLLHRARWVIWSATEARKTVSA